MRDMLFVYGTLREEDAKPAQLVNFRKRIDAQYPTIEPHEGSVVEGQLVEVDDWVETDRYEGRVPGKPGESLYWRLDMADGTQVYVGNPEVAAKYWMSAWDVGYDRESVVTALADSLPEVEG